MVRVGATGLLITQERRKGKTEFREEEGERVSRRMLDVLMMYVPSRCFSSWNSLSLLLGDQQPLTWLAAQVVCRAHQAPEFDHWEVKMAKCWLGDGRGCGIPVADGQAA